MFFLLRKVFNFLFSLAFYSTILILLIFHHFTKDLPGYDQLINYKPDVKSSIYSKNGDYLASLFVENRIQLPTEMIPAIMKYAAISAEDKDFYENSGIDVMGIVRSAVQNVKNYISDKKELVGGSTITQQIIKNIMLSKEKTLERKIKEARLALGVNKHLTKDQIIERYLNHIYLGNNSYGVAIASLNYFGKPISHINIQEAALLASLAQAPSRLDPTKSENLERLFERRNWVIGRMHEYGYITKDLMKKAQESPMEVHPYKANVTQKTMGIEYVMDETKRTIAKIFPKEPSKALTDGFTIHSTIDEGLQEIVTDVLRRGLLSLDAERRAWTGPLTNLKTPEDYRKFINSVAQDRIHPFKAGYIISNNGGKIKLLVDDEEIEIKETNAKIQKNARKGDVVLLYQSANGKNYKISQHPKINGAILVMDVKNGNILAIAGGFSHYDNQFNRATQALRQPGSAFKPVIYLTALEMGYSPFDTLFDEPIEISQGKGLPPWQPKNYGGDYMGAVSMQTSLALSRNLSTVFLARELGLKNVIKTAKKLHLFSEDYKDENFAEMLGSKETTLLDMVRAYAIFANGGLDINPSIIESIEDQSGKIIWTNEKLYSQEADLSNKEITPEFLEEPRTRLVSPRAAHLLLGMLEHVVRHGTANRIASFGGHLGAKTGTSNDNKDAWFMVISKNLAFGVYVGYDTPRSLGSRSTGGTIAGPIARDFISLAGPYIDKSPFDTEAEMKKFDQLAAKLENFSSDGEDNNFVEINRQLKESDKEEALIPKFKPSRSLKTLPEDMEEFEEVEEDFEVFPINDMVARD